MRTSVAIDPVSGAAEEGALFTYEALPRGTVLLWDITCRNPRHFKIDKKDIAAVGSPGDVHKIIADGLPYMEALGVWARLLWSPHWMRQPKKSSGGSRDEVPGLFGN